MFSIFHHPFAITHLFDQKQPLCYTVASLSYRSLWAGPICQGLENNRSCQESADAPFIVQYSGFLPSSIIRVNHTLERGYDTALFISCDDSNLRSASKKKCQLYMDTFSRTQNQVHLFILSQIFPFLLMVRNSSQTSLQTFPRRGGGGTRETTCGPHLYSLLQ